MLNVSNLHKSFGTLKAVNGVSFTVAKGEVLGFLGPNLDSGELKISVDQGLQQLQG